MASVHVDYYVDTMSSWCLIAEQAIDQLRTEFGKSIELEWKVVQLNEGAPFEDSPEKFGWFYGRTKAVTGVQLNPAWHKSMLDSSVFPNLAAEAARTLGVTGDRVRRALSEAAMNDGQHVPAKEVALKIAADASGLDKEKLRETMDAHETLAKIMTNTIELRKLPVNVISTFVITNDIRDVAILSGFHHYETLAAIVREALHASIRYDEYMARVPEPGP
ncbi:MAG: DsbA family protein [Candidatus Eremiobacteraeota bacterium]|nr:DsbA family protein [Candidatus Eremiobacteraeota bacterium]